MTKLQAWFLIASVCVSACKSSGAHPHGPTGGAIILPSAGNGAGLGAAGVNAQAHDAGAQDDAAAISGNSDAGVMSTACCDVHGAPGCNDATVQKCVCDQVGSCCTTGWDIVCVNLVASLGCGSCKGDCCTESQASGGCNDAKVEACVCAGDATCCSDLWDPYCVVLVDGLSCGKCM